MTDTTRSKRRSRARLATLTAAALMTAAAPLAAPLAHAYDASATHPGLTARAALASRLHRFLRREWGLELGLFHGLRLDQAQMDRRRHAMLLHKLRRLDPSGGYRPDANGRLHAAGWLLAGSVLADVPATRNRHHYYSPVLRRGLDNQRPLLTTWHALLGAMEGGDSLRELLTGAGFDLTGKSALDWIGHKHNPLSTKVMYEALRKSLTASEPRQRQHQLARALLCLGALLAVLQDMAVPGHVRDDFLGDATRKLGTTGLDRGSAYERYVAAAYGRVGLPRAGGSAPRFSRLRDYFSNQKWTGLADRTAVAHFSSGTVPPMRHVAMRANIKSLRRSLTRALRFSQPALPPIRRCPIGRVCYANGKHGLLLSYRVDRQQRLHFFLDNRVHADTARHLLPLAINYSRGVIDFVLRARLTLRRQGDQLIIGNSGVALASAKVALYVDDDSGARRLLKTIDAKLPAQRGAALARLQITLPENARRLVVVAEGTDANKQPFIAAATLQRKKKEKKPAPTSKPAKSDAQDGKPIWKEDGKSPASKPAPASKPTSKPSTAKPAATGSPAKPASQPSTPKPASKKPSAKKASAKASAKKAKPKRAKPKKAKPKKAKPKKAKPKKAKPEPSTAK